MKLVLATHNKDKCKEMQQLLLAYPLQVLSLDSFLQIGEIIEDGSTLEENALIKAREVHRQTGLPSWADDTGLEVEYLNGAPGVYSARFAGEKCSYKDNVKKLLQTLEGVPHIRRNAVFRTVIAFVDENRELTTEGFVEGSISTLAKGVGGFGYDPVFYVPELEKTYSEMTMTEKNQISHRGRAIRNMIKLLGSHFPETFQVLEDEA
ncbi:MAG: RdgB/HAM1 family non-canonical purine NTP pyrophosphatase [Candidatus Marinimicrobia bacterium]|nr:RdgB/HAM1 family non-canonical purine NTP pyrophosphatase [Candidatus Neomarinimicrobiota bacterium]